MCLCEINDYTKLGQSHYKYKGTLFYLIETSHTDVKHDLQ